MVEILALLLRDHRLRRAVQGLWDGVKEVRDWVLGLAGSVEVGDVKVKLREKTDISTNWQSYGDGLMAMLAVEGPPLLLLIDEFPLMVSDMADADADGAAEFLRWFRRARLAPDTRTRFVIGGSTNIMYSLEALGLVDTINDLCPVKLRPFDEATAAAYVDAMFASRRLTADPEARARILDLVGEPIPYLLALLVQTVFGRVQGRGERLDTGLVEAAFDDLLQSGAAVFLHYWSRLNRHYPGRESDAAKALLTVLSRADGPVGRDTLYHVYLKARNVQASPQHQDDFVRLMWKLDNDFYIVARDDGYAFFSRVLKLWWRRHHGYQEG